MRGNLYRIEIVLRILVSKHCSKIRKTRGYKLVSHLQNPGKLTLTDRTDNTRHTKSKNGGRLNHVWIVQRHTFDGHAQLKTALVATRLASVAVLWAEHAVTAEETLVLLSLHYTALEEPLHGKHRRH